MISVLVVTGPIGVGKSAVLHEADSVLVAAGSCHATVELEEIARCWSPGIGHDRRPFVYRSLAAVWANFEEVGADRLLLSALVERRADLERVVEAVSGAVVTVARLHAPLAVLEQRIRSREAGLAVEGELDGARWWTRHFDEEQPEDFVIATDARAVREVAEEMLRRAGWLA
jgi:adenylylsulfate kinase-like enzyme